MPLRLADYSAHCRAGFLPLLCLTVSAGRRIITIFASHIFFNNHTAMAFHNQLGAAGETAAKEFLIKQGLTIRETNWRLNHLEIDIVAQSPGQVLHIVEVKTRSTDAHFDPMRAVTRQKQRRLVSAANGYMQYYKLRMAVQYDVVILVGNPQSGFKLEYYPNAFYPALRTYR